jgi:hypothetical protein
VVRSSQLQERKKLPPLMTGKRSWAQGTFDHVVIQIHQNKVVGGQLHLFISALDTHDVRARSFDCLD